ncbi:MAG: hypothetical protein AB2L14_22335 [Candidatus Xenobiia bacterium LiM19]
MDRSMIREEVMFLLERIPEEKMPAVKEIIESILILMGQGKIPRTIKEYTEWIDSLPCDNEPLGEEEIQALRDSDEDIKAGCVSEWDEVVKEL